MKQKIYIDTSVLGGYFDEEFKDATQKLFERLDGNEIVFVVSDLLDLELIDAPTRVRELLHKYSADKFLRVEMTEEAIQLADRYITGYFGANYATHFGVDYATDFGANYATISEQTMPLISEQTVPHK